MKRSGLLLALALLLGTQTAHARDAFEWNFLNSSIPGRWELQRLTTATPTVGGLHIKTETEGRMARLTEFPHRVESITISFGPSNGTEAIFLWHVRGSPESEMVELPFFIEGGPESIVELTVDNYPQWDPLADRIGIAFPPGADVTIERMEFFKWNIFEKTWYAAKSFWKFDRFRPYTINFVWSPVIAFNPVNYQRLFLTAPPIGWSVNRFFFAAMLIAGVGCFVWHRRTKTKKPLLTFLLILGTLWSFYDLRMGLEMISYYIHDYRTYIAVNADERAFRDRGYFYDFVHEVVPHVQGRDRYIFLSQFRWPYFGAVRYLTYPSIPTEPTQAANGVDTWVIYQRPDMTINDQGMLMLEGQAVSTPGRVLLDFAPGSFVFRTNPQ